MELAYIWVEKFRNFEKQGFHFTTKYTFSYNFTNTHLDVQPKEESNNVPLDFFGSSINNVTAIIGENATGKTNVLELIAYFADNVIKELNTNFIVSYINDMGHPIIYFHGIEDFQSNYSFEKYKEGILGTRIIYLSNVFDQRKHSFSRKKLINLSTNDFVNNSFGSNIAINIKKDLQNQLKFISSHNNQVDELNIVPKGITLIGPNWGNIQSKAEHFDRLLNVGLWKSQENIGLQNFCKKYMGLFSKIKDPKEAFFHYTAFLTLMDYLYNRFSKSSDNLKGEYGILIIERIRSLLKLDNINEIFNFITDKIAADISLNSPDVSYESADDIESQYNEDKLGNFLNRLKPEKHNKNILFEITSISSDGAGKNSKPQFNLVYNSEAVYFVKNYLDSITNHSISFNIIWNGISSGEFAFISLLSRVFSVKHRTRRYNSIILLIDEGDLYLHPKWQSEYLFNLLQYLPALLNYRSLQVVLTSHSPFLVSDLPKENIIILSKVSSNTTTVVLAKNIIGETFAGNIPELYMNKFFLKDNIVSKFAMKKITSALQKFKEDGNEIELKYLINIIGDEYLANKLRRILDDKYTK